MSHSITEKPVGGLRLFGVGINIDPSWLLFAVFVGWQVSSGYFPELEGLSRGAYVTVAVLVVLGLSLSILLHEMAHTLAGRAMGMTINRITLYMFGGVAELRHEPRTGLSELIMALAGPVLSVVLSFVLKALSVALQGEAPVEVVLSLDYLADINLILAIFNMIPAFPLDGGRVLRALIWIATKRVGFATRIAATLGQGFGVLLMLLGGYFVLMGGLGSGIWYVLLGLLMLRMASAGRRYAPED